MIKTNKIPLFILSLPFFANAQNPPKNIEGQTEELDVITVTTKALQEKEKGYVKTGAITGRDEIMTSTQSLDNIVRSVPGAFTQIDKSQGTISVNVRGATGFGRVNTMIDGVTQTFYSSSTDGGGRAGGTSQFGTLIDPSFLVSLDVERGSFSGSGGANSLMGALNFKTLGVNDLVDKDKNFGLMLKRLDGSNHLGPNSMAALGGKYNFSDERWFGGVVAYSKRHISQDYRIGGGRRVTESSIDLSGLDEDDRAQVDTSPYDAAHLVQTPISRLAKLEYGDHYQQSTLSYRDYKADVAGRVVLSNSNQINYQFAIPDSRWLNLKLLYNLTGNTQEYQKGIRYTGKTLLKDMKVKNDVKTFDINNGFNFDFGPLHLDTTLGWNLLRNDYYKNRHPTEFRLSVDNDEDQENPDCFGLNCIKKSLTATVFQPDGKQKISTLYMDNELRFGIFSLNLNGNISRYKYQGERYKYIPYYHQSLEAEYERERDPIRSNQLSDELDAFREKYCTYQEDYYEYECEERNLAITSRGQGKLINYSATLSAQLHDLFVPFVSYSKTGRAPNIREMYFSNVGDWGVNDKLKPEVAKTLQFGVSGFREGLFTDEDKLGFKLAVYHTKIKDYIYNYAKWTSYGPVISHINQDKVKTRGLELELNYDLGRFYFTLAYARQKTDQPISFTDGSSRVNSEPSINSQGYGVSKISILPKEYASLDIGTRWFDQKWIIGTLIKYYGESERATPHMRYGYNQRNQIIAAYRVKETIPKQPFIFDFYTSYEPIKNFVIKGEIQNLFDKKYIDPLDSNNDSANQTFFNIDFGAKHISVLNNYARGRTYVLSLNYKF